MKICKLMIRVNSKYGSYEEEIQPVLEIINFPETNMTKSLPVLLLGKQLR